MLELYVSLLQRLNSFSAQSLRSDPGSMPRLLSWVHVRLMHACDYLLRGGDEEDAASSQALLTLAHTVSRDVKRLLRVCRLPPLLSVSCIQSFDSGTIRHRGGYRRGEY